MDYRPRSILHVKKKILRIKILHEFPGRVNGHDFPLQGNLFFVTKKKRASEELPGQRGHSRLRYLDDLIDDSFFGILMFCWSLNQKQLKFIYINSILERDFIRFGDDRLKKGVLIITKFYFIHIYANMLYWCIQRRFP
ncbi:hypothetical protein CEXT_750661 [Caerostris extrusa]|uniref:Uncharacterized protein n=1 Tax=Caerostris extrusa TaxID=172846 RepID=A0AAV4SZL8_CAEEX|nr:hypothetical protein CEXT_750661 [Caerostris extrusa]